MTRRFAQFTRNLQVRLERLFDAPLDADASPIEITQAVADEIERRVQAVGRGRRVFPYARVVVRILGTNGERPALEAAFAGLGDRLRERLAELGCETAGALDVRVVLLKKLPADWTPGRPFAIEYQAGAAARQTTGPPAMTITILKGAASKKAYTFAEPLVAIGRTADPTDEDGRIRRNRVAFLDTVDGVTETVGRVHAQIRFDSGRGEYRLYDDGSSNGTSVVRDGAAIRVPPRDPRGIRLSSGDEIHVGRAVLRVGFAIETPASSRR